MPDAGVVDSVPVVPDAGVVDSVPVVPDAGVVGPVVVVMPDDSSPSANTCPTNNNWRKNKRTDPMKTLENRCCSISITL